MSYYKEKDVIFEELNTSTNGLNNDAVKDLLSKNGKNVFPQGKKKNLLNIFLSQFKSAIILILIIAIIASLIIGEYTNAIFIGIVVAINSIIGTTQEYNAEKSAEKLQEMIKVQTTVIRNGSKLLVDASDIVVGDIILLESGNKVPADLRLIETHDLKIDESILTGESVEVLKNTETIPENVKKLSYTNIAYAGSIVISGRGVGVVVATGTNTELGKIAHNVITMKQESSPLVIRINKFSKQISILFTCLIIVLSIVLFMKGYLLREIFFSVIALTVSAIPEGLSTAMTITLSFSSKRMVDKNVIVKKLSAVESLGSCTVIASDKTGTLTVNEQTAKIITFPWGENINVLGEGYNDYGKIEYNKKDKLLEERINLITKLGYINNESELKNIEGKWHRYGDSIDVAFLSLGLKQKVNTNAFKVLANVPYESENKYSATYFLEGKRKVLTIKGATETILDFCDKMITKTGTEKINKQSILNQLDHLSSKGYRVIAIAYCNKNNIEFGNIKNNFKGLTFVGLVSFIDPIRPDALISVKECLNAGIKVYMITGDHPKTAFNIGKKLNLVKNYNEVATGVQIDEEFSKGQEHFDKFIKKVKICARVSPLQKLMIVESLKRQGEFVAVTGDGVNDTPALKSANIGIAMGSGTDLAKETGDMIITDDNFTSIVESVKEGRVAYNNIRSVIYMLLSTGFCEVILYVFSILLNLPFPLLAIQFLWLNLITNGIESNFMAFEKSSTNVMQEKLKSKNDQIFNKLFITETLISSFVMGLISLSLYLILYNLLKLDITLVRTYLLTFMIFIEDIHVFNCRSEKLSTFKIPAKNNIALMISVTFSLLAAITFIYIPGVNSLFNLSAIPLLHVFGLLALSFVIIAIMEIFKKLYFTNKKP